MYGCKLYLENISHASPNNKLKNADFQGGREIYNMK